MQRYTGYRVQPFTVNRRMSAAGAAVARRHDTIHTITEVDVTEPRRLIREHAERSNERLSFTAYVVTCLARAIAEDPYLNSLRKGRRLILLDDVTVAVLVERTTDGEHVPEPFGIPAADKKSFRQIHDEIRAAQQENQMALGGLSGATWVRFIPSCLFRMFMTVAARSIHMARRYGVVAVTAVGMVGDGPLRLVPLSAATVAVAVGGIVGRTVVVEGLAQTREHLCLTISFDHDIVDGAPAARFTKRFAELLASGEAIRAETQARRAEDAASWNGTLSMSSLPALMRPIRDDEHDFALAVINAAAQRYHGVIPADCWHEPYFPAQYLESEIAAGVRFFGYLAEGELLGVMGVQDVHDVTLIRHAYVRPRAQRAGIGGELLRHLLAATDKPALIGTWADARWAIAFYEKHGFTRMGPEQSARLLRRYWDISERQIETSVVLAQGTGARPASTPEIRESFPACNRLRG